MNKYPIAIFFNPPEICFEYGIVARLVRVSVEFIQQCEREELITSRIMLHGAKGLCSADINKLKLIRYLHEDMGLALEAVDFVLRYRDQIKTMKRQIVEMEQRLRQKEQQHQTEILALYRRLEQCNG
ncbi:MAG: hypothetical protein IH613_03030 [Desulfuromonadales bacterium]|nr:hypothetical protein [Desulfuromonadales bacterium]